MAGGGKENSMSDCLFCKIANHELESSYIYEDDMIVAFNDIQPQAPVHFLVVPKKHIQSLDALTDEDRELVAHIMLKIPELAKEQGIETLPPHELEAIRAAERAKEARNAQKHNS